MALNALVSRKSTMASLYCVPRGLTFMVISEGKIKSRRTYWLLYMKLLCLGISFKTQINGSHFLESGSVGLGRPRICISNRFPGRANAANMETAV